METMKTKILLFSEKMCKGVIIFLAGIVLCFFSIAGFVEQAYIAQDNRESCVFLKHGILFYLLIFLSLILILYVRNFLSKINSKTLFCVLSCFYLVAGMYLIFNTTPSLRHDAQSVFQGAMAFNQGDFSSLEKGEYLAQYPFQLGMVTYERIFMIFSPSVVFFFALNLLMVFIINYMQWKISEILSKNNVLVVNYTIVFSFAFLPQLFFILFLYGWSPGFCSLISAVYFMMRYFQERKLKDCIFSIILVALACTLRNNFMIAAIAVFFLYLLDYFRYRKKRCLLIALVTIVCAVTLPKGVNIWYHYESKIDFDAGNPKLLWVAMGLQENGTGRMGGWYNGYVETIPLEYNYDYALALERGQADLQRRLDYLRENRRETFYFFTNKIKSTWLDPLFQSIWSGPSEQYGQFMYTKLLSDLYAGKGIYWFLTRFLDIVLVIIYLMSLVYMIFAVLIKKIDLTCEQIFPYLYLFGGFLFHLIWETKSQYVYPYVFVLIPVAALGIDLLGVDFVRYLDRVRRKTSI